MYIFLLVLGGGQDKPAWTACPPGVKITRVGGKISRDSLPPGGQANHGWLVPRGASCPGGKINWDTGPFFPPSKMLGSFYLSSRLLDYVILLLYLNSLDLYQAENQVFKPTSLFVIVGWGKTGPAHSFPPP